jgi:hypothetical protein
MDPYEMTQLPLIKYFVFKGKIGIPSKVWMNHSFPLFFHFDPLASNLILS